MQTNPISMRSLNYKNKSRRRRANRKADQERLGCSNRNHLGYIYTVPKVDNLYTPQSTMQKEPIMRKRTKAQTLLYGIFYGGCFAFGVFTVMVVAGYLLGVLTW